MKRMTCVHAAWVMSAVLAMAAVTAGRGEEPKVGAPATRPAKRIEVCFVLDTTGSMSGLIEGAKAKIWTIANDVLKSTSPRPEVRFAIIGYRDRGDEYITKKFDLTDDIDEVFKNLSSFQAGGGGDMPESVNQGLDEAVHQVGWTKGGDVTRIVFLVGDCPPHMDYQDDVKYQKSCEDAARAEIVINTVQCGRQSETTAIWQEIARLGEGKFVQLEQTGGMVAESTPMDEEIARLSAEVDRTVVAYGSARTQAEVKAKAAVAQTQPAAAVAGRASYNVASERAVQGRGDLLVDLRDGVVKLDDVKETDLPEELKKLPKGERQAYLDELVKKRAALQKQVAELAKKRQDYLDQKKAEREKAGEAKDAFDASVAEAVREQVNKPKK